MPNEQTEKEPEFNPVDKGALEYQPTTWRPERQENSFEDMWGKLPTDRFRNVGRMLWFKITDDDTEALAAAIFFQFHIPRELDGARLVRAAAAVTTVSASLGPIQVMVSNFAYGDMLSTAINIDDGEETSYTAATQPVINQAQDRNVVHTGDLLEIGLNDQGDGNAKGLQVFLTFQ